MEQMKRLTSRQTIHHADGSEHVETYCHGHRFGPAAFPFKWGSSDQQEYKNYCEMVDTLAAMEDIIYNDDGTARLSLWEMSILMSAYSEGRCMIQPPPAKEGDPKPICFDDYADGIWCLGYQTSKTDDEPSERCKQCWYCSAGNYADDREAAEAAMGGGGDG